MANYRRIWSEVNGPIPKDSNGISFEIHHLDGNRDNNSIENLVCVSIQDHYNIHFSQGDFYACASIAKRMNMTKEERKILSENISISNKKRVGPLNPFYRKKHTEETKQILRIKNSGPNHVFYGKKRPKHSEYMKEEWKTRVLSDEGKHNIRKAQQYKAATNPIRAAKWLISKDGISFEIKNLKKFCRDNGLDYREMYFGKCDNGYYLLGKA